MKTLLLLLLTAICFQACDYLSPVTNNDETKTHDKIINTPKATPKLNYNPKKDSLFYGILMNEKPIITRMRSYDRPPRFEVCTLTYSNYRFVVWYDFYVKFEQKENWTFFCLDSVGGHILIGESLSQPKHRVSQKTYDKLMSFVTKRK